MVSADPTEGKLTLYKCTCNNLVPRGLIYAKEAEIPLTPHGLSVHTVTMSWSLPARDSVTGGRTASILACSSLHLEMSFRPDSSWIKECPCDEILWGNFHNTRVYFFNPNLPLLRCFLENELNASKYLHEKKMKFKLEAWLFFVFCYFIDFPLRRYSRYNS